MRQKEKDGRNKVLRRIIHSLAFASFASFASVSSFAAFYASAGKVEITPDLNRHKVYLAGFGARGRPAVGVHDPLYARGLLISDGRNVAAIVAVDLLGLFREQVLDVRRELSENLCGTYVFLSATHVHSGPDTLGLWGRWPGFSGVDRNYLSEVTDKIRDLVTDLSSRLQESTVVAAKVEVPPAGLARDLRDPVVIDPDLVALRFKGPGRGTIATLVNWSCHPEVLGPENNLVTADYPGFLCSHIEDVLGGTCVFLQGSLGGMLTPDVQDGGSFDEARRIGRRIADISIKALEGGRAVVPDCVAFSSRTVILPVENSRYLLFLPSLSFGHAVLDASLKPLSFWKIQWWRLRHLIRPVRSGFPRVETEVSRIRFGPIEILGIPGEIFPELVVGGFDGSLSFGCPLVSPGNPAPPDVAAAPKGPYLKEKMSGRYRLVVGLANDEIGYVVPGYDFVVNPNRVMHPRPPGHHYEETNSLGKHTAPLLLDAIDLLLK